MARAPLAPRTAAVLVVLQTVLVGVARADGIGLIGWGKDMYRPACAAACRNLVKSCRLLCTPKDGGVNHGTSHSPVATPPECFTSDAAFLRTVAVCIDNYCPGSDAPDMAVVDDFWASHLGTGTVGDYTWVPVVGYRDALAAGRADERRAAAVAAGVNATHVDGMSDGHGHARRHDSHEAATAAPPGTPDVRSALPAIANGEPLNVTSFIGPRDWQLQYNGYLDFEQNEAGHATYTIAVTLVALLVPVAALLLRFATGPPWTRARAALVHRPLWGRRHRAPVAAGAVVVPTRAQALYMALVSFLNVIFLLAPYTIRQPQATFASRARQETSVIGNRAGQMAMGNAVALTVFAARNSPLFFGRAGWSYGTYMVLHRWLGYWTVIHTVLHSVLLLAYYVAWGDYRAELAREYWVWGVVGTVAAVAIVPSSLPVVRRRVYEFFLASHVTLSLLFIVGYYYHIWYCYEHRWGYEIWAYIMGTIWGVERLARLARLVRPALAGARTAAVTVVPGTDDEYVRIDIEGLHVTDGVVYLGFPSLGWRFWEFHPFSVAFAVRHDEESPRAVVAETADQIVGEGEKEGGGDKSRAATVTKPTTAASTFPGAPSTGPVTTFFARTRTGMTKQLAARASTAGVHHRPARLRVLIEGPYQHAGSAGAAVAGCPRLVCVAGGVGVTACLPYLARHHHQHGAAPATLYWSARHQGLVDALAPVLAPWAAGAVETRVGGRWDVAAVVGREFAAAAAAAAAGNKEAGPVGVVVCGPAGMADDVRDAVLGWNRAAVVEVPFVLVDEAFSW